MSAPLILTLLWFVVANLVAMLPSRDHHWTAAYLLVGVGVPLLGWLTVVNGPVAGTFALAAGASVLRWPVIHLWRWLKRRMGPPAEPAE